MNQREGEQGGGMKYTPEQLRQIADRLNGRPMASFDAVELLRAHADALALLRECEDELNWANRRLEGMGLGTAKMKALLAKLREAK